MSKKVFWVIMIPALLLIGSYTALQIFLRTGNGNERNNGEQKMTAHSISAQSGKKSTQNQPPGQNKTTEETADTNRGTSDNTRDSVGGKKVSPLDLRPLFIQKLQHLVRKSSNGLYNLSIGDLKMDVFASTVSLHNVSLRPDAQAVQDLKASGLLPENVLTASFESLFIDGINLDDAITSKTMDYKSIRLVKPHIEMERQKVKKKKSNEDFSQRFLKEIEKLSIEKLQVEGGTILVKDKAKNDVKKLQNVQVLMKNILLNDITRKANDRFLFAKEAQLQFHDFNMKTKDGLYTMKIGDAFVNATGRQVKLRNVSYNSHLSKEAFMARQKAAEEMYDLSLPSITINGVDWWPALNGEAITANEMQMEGGTFSVYFDRSLPPQNRMGNFPNQALMRLPLKVDVNKLKIRNIDVSYEEHNPRSAQSGTVYLDNVAIDIANITNKEKLRDSVVVTGSALLMHEVPLKARFVFDLKKAKEGAFSATINVDGFEGDVMNSIAKPLGLMKVEKGEVQQFQVKMSGNELGATGEATMLYEKLKLSVLKKGRNGSALRKQHLMSFFANLFVLKNDNPWWLTGKTRRKEAYFQRDPEAGFMNLVWKTALVGTLKTLGAPAKLAEKKK